MRIHVEQHGCTTTEAEKRELESRAVAAGHTVVGSVEEADAVALVTCAVLEGTERRMLNRVEQLAGTGKRLLVGGCLTGVRPEAILDRAPAAELLAPGESGAGSLDPGDRALDPGDGQGAAVVEDGDALPMASNTLPMAGDGPMSGTPSPPRAAPGPTEAFAIASGCTSACTFCATKQARGHVESRPLGDVVAQVRRAVEQGTREVYLTSQDTADYGADKGPDASRLPDLVRAVASLPGAFRVRVGMMNPAPARGIADGLADVLGLERVYTFLHLPVQSGSDRVLARMGRRHDAAAFSELVDVLRAAEPDLSLATDVICGFPGETDADHDATVELVEEAAPEMVNITRFSKRPGTPAAAMDDQVPSQVKKARSKELTEVCRRARERALRRRVGRTERVLWVANRGGTGVVGRTDHYRPVRCVEGDGPGEPGSFGRVRVVDVDGVHLVGEIVG